MQWCLLLIWAQGLRQATLPASGAMAGSIVTTGNISAEEGGSVTLRCQLSYTMATVIQVNWKLLDQTLAIHHTEFGWNIYPAFSKRVIPGPGLDLTLQRLTINNTGEYFCIYYTFPDGIYQGRLFLEVLGSSVAKRNAGFQKFWLGAMVTALVCCTAVIVVVALFRKKRALQIHSAESGTPSEQENWHPGTPSSSGNDIQVAAPANLHREQMEGDYAEPHDYFNVLSYRSLGSFNFLAQTG
ncbi:PREDICTED: T-cell immunoreceptor with Ig and ITIM domains [Chrysochloris asiatica]|uniref:T-cell immunoreceptor with Ig and ITIM domains n=1 Tax=Chrysochloris asiatica TaxID=185453 RepID=UPI0003F166A4|nr:PREDICTED: T-cell immunoreceptor with Ig and ITIM domains [Chrysochloris asiatica]